uniref:Signal peptide peptidaselike putative n=1 Tax=Albugo laibachii Nc14 TaxID=890382 RepID=F0VYU0_9STRA|nr:signal peptide peptidaselike putative [Albugo laibachii Nc14]|eukprot:CCA13955.1 signal peptide peptidaselike putative [Albugo laibachii Nc14]
MISELCAPSTRAGWGQTLPAEQTYYGKLISPATRFGQDSQGCIKNSVSHTSDVPLVDRGGCSFLKKAQNAQEAGAKAVIVRGTRKATYESIIKTYSQGRVKNSVAFGFLNRPHFEYDCTRGESNVTTIKDPIWDTDDSYCSQIPSCHSKMCIPTGVIDTSDGGIPKYQLCCLWDTHILIGANDTLAKNISIPVAYVTIEEGIRLEKAAVAEPRVYLLQRPHQLANWSSIVLWLIGVLTAVGASFYSLSRENRRYIAPENIELDEIEDSHLLQHDQYEYLAQDVQEVDGASAVGFVICAGSFLMLLYYFDIGRLFPIIFGLSAMGSLYSVICMPLLHLLLPYLSTWRCNISSIFRHFVVTVGLLEVLGVLGSATITFLWYLYRNQCWYLQNILGIVLCCSFLKNIEIPNLRVATILLSLAFVYDIFFVFISPFIFGSSVMERVATGGAPANTRIDYPGIDYCERYPHYAPCKDPQPLPMLLLIPQFDWRGGFTMLGLGDIIVPGLLISLGLRFDCCLAKSKYFLLSGKLRQIPGETKVYASLLTKPAAAQNRWQVQYYITASIAFAVGLGMANTAVSFSGLGQPALMYLVPCTLGATILRAWMNNELKLFWSEFKHDMKADVQDDIRETTLSP